jgi:hypothetical protein
MSTSVSALDNYPEWLRWSLIPVVFVATGFAIHILSYCVMWLLRTIDTRIPHDSVYAAVQNHLFVGAVVGFYTIHLTVKVAPKQKFVTALILAGVICLCCGITLNYAFLDRDYWLVAEVVCTGIAAGCAVLNVKNEH